MAMCKALTGLAVKGLMSLTICKLGELTCVYIDAVLGTDRTSAMNTALEKDRSA